MRLPFVLWILCPLAGILGITLLAWQPNEAPPVPQPSAVHEPAATAAAAAASGDAGPVTEATPQGADPAASDEPADVERTEVAATDMSKAPKVRIVRGNPGVPVADAEVLFVTETEARQRLSPVLPPPRIEWPERFGQRTASDRDGLAQLAVTREPWFVGAVAGGEFAFAIVPPGARTVDMLLQRDETLRLRVLRADGSPGAGVPVALLQLRDGEDVAAELWQGLTDRAGNAAVPHFQLARQAVRGAPAKERFAAMLVMTMPVPVVTEFAGRPAPAEPVRLVLPNHASVEVLLTDHRDAPLLSPAEVALWIERPRDFVQLFPVPPHLDRPREQKPVGAVPVLFHRIGAGSVARIGARFPGVERAGAMSEPLTMPLQDGALLETQLRLPNELALLAGRLVHEDDLPFALSSIEGCLWRADRPLGTVTVHTIADGRFDLVQRPSSDGADLWLELRAVEVLAEGLSRDVGARVRFQALRDGERRELGQIVLGELPPLCSGVVVDDRDVPVTNAEVTVQRLVPQQPRPNRVGNQPAPPRPRRPEGAVAEAEQWAAVPLLQTRSDAEGRFFVQGVLPPGQLRVRADSGLHFAASQPLHMIGQQLRIRIDRNGILRGRVLLPDFVADGSVTMTLRPFDESLRQRDSRSLGLLRQRGGRFVLEPLRPGRYDLIVALRNVPEPLCVLTDVFVTPGEVRDGRLRPLDLRQSLFRYRLRAVDIAGRALGIDGPILARVRRQDGTVADAGFRWQRGRAELITGSSLAEIIAFGRGCEPTPLTLGPGDTDVYMRQLVPAQLQLPGARMLCGDERRVRVSTILIEASGWPQSLSGVDQRTGEAYSFPRSELGNSNGAWLGVSDIVEVPLSRSGKYEVVLRVHATASERSPQASVSLGTYELRVDGSGPMPVTVAVDSAKVLEAIAALRPRAARGR